MNSSLSVEQILAGLSAHEKKFAFIAVNSEREVTEVSEGCRFYFDRPPVIGAQIDEVMDFMLGISVEESLRLPLVETDHGIPMSVSVLNYADQHYIVLTDASGELENKRAIQQIANTNELLLNEKEQLLKTLRKKTASLEQASRLQNAFLAGVAHEFRSPLVSVLGYADLIEQAQEESESQKDDADPKAQRKDIRPWVRGIKRSSRHLLNLIENLLDHGKAEDTGVQINMGPVDLAALLEDVGLLLGPQARAKELRLMTVLNGSDENLASVWITSDQDRLMQCLVNIVGNAIKFTDKGSVIIEMTHEHDLLRIAVTDTGMGMSEYELEMINEPFWQADHILRPGTGLGFTITEGIVEVLGGNIAVTSEEGVGTQVVIELPVSETVAPSTQAVAIEAGLSRPARLLLVEDDDDIAVLLETLLENAGFEVVRAPDGVVGSEQASAEKFDVILMDVVMPNLNGFEAAKQIRLNGVSTPIVMMSASEQEFETYESGPLDYDAYLLKPIEIAHVVAICEELIPNNG